MMASELDKELLLILFGYRYSNTVSQKVLTRCEVCERPLDDERFLDTELDQLIRENEPILEALKAALATPPIKEQKG